MNTDSFTARYKVFSMFTFFRLMPLKVTVVHILSICIMLFNFLINSTIRYPNSMNRKQDYSLKLYLLALFCWVPQATALILSWLCIPVNTEAGADGAPLGG